MSKEQFDDNCKGCKPVLLTFDTLKPLPDDHPHMMAVNALWAKQTMETKQAWHRVTCQKSMDSTDLLLSGAFVDLIEETCRANNAS